MAGRGGERTPGCRLAGDPPLDQITGRNGARARGWEPKIPPVSQLFESVNTVWKVADSSLLLTTESDAAGDVLSASDRDRPGVLNGIMKP